MNEIWVSCDWHLYNTKNNDSHPYKSERIIRSIQEEFRVIEDSDLFIFLGDLFDPEVLTEDQHRQMKDMIQNIKGYKVMCFGNHDNMDKSYYLDLGFQQVADIFTYENFVFSHKPVKVDIHELNIHGHLHDEIRTMFGHQYINAYRNMDNGVCVPTKLTDLLKIAAEKPHTVEADTVTNHTLDKYKKYAFDNYDNDPRETADIVDLTDMLGLVESVIDNEILDEILFQDIEDTKYWEADDDSDDVPIGESIEPVCTIPDKLSQNDLILNKPNPELSAWIDQTYAQLIKTNQLFRVSLDRVYLAADDANGFTTSMLLDIYKLVKASILYDTMSILSTKSWISADEIVPNNIDPRHTLELLQDDIPSLADYINSGKVPENESYWQVVFHGSITMLQIPGKDILDYINALFDLYEHAFNLVYQLNESVIAKNIITTTNRNAANTSLTKYIVPIKISGLAQPYDMIVSSFASDILNNEIRINPEMLNLAEMEHWKSMEDIVKRYQSIHEYWKDETSPSTYSLPLDIQYVSIMSACGGDVKNLDLIRKKYKGLSPFNLNEHELSEYLNQRINELSAVESMLSEIAINTIAGALLTSERSYQIASTTTKSKYIKSLKDYVDHRDIRDKIIQINDDKSITLDYSCIGRGKVFIASTIESYMRTPSRYLARLTMYDYIIVSHGNQYVTNDAHVVWNIDPITIRGKSYTDLIQALDALDAKHNKILAISCNSMGLQLPNNYYNVDYSDSYTLTEATGIAPSGKSLSGDITAWNNYIDQRLKAVSNLAHQLKKIPEAMFFVTPPKSISTLAFTKKNRLIEICEYKVKSEKDVVDIYKNRFNDIINRYHTALLYAKLLCRDIKHANERCIMWDVSVELSETGVNYLNIGNCSDDVSLTTHPYWFSQFSTIDEASDFITCCNQSIGSERNLYADVKTGCLAEAATKEYKRRDNIAPIDRDEKKQIADKYGLRSPGQMSFEEQEALHKTPDERVKEKREKNLQNLKRARKIKKRKAFVRKVKSHIPGIKNEEYSVDGIQTEDHPLWGTKGDFFYNYNEPHEANTAAERLDESTGSDVFTKILSLNTELNKYQYCMGKNYRVASPKQFVKQRGGVCWDFATYEAHTFKTKFKDVQYKTYYVVFEVPPYYPTHTFLTFEYRGKHYYFESSFVKYQGVYMADSEADIINFVLYNMGHYNDRSDTKKVQAAAKKNQYALFEYDALHPDIPGSTTVEFMQLMEQIGREIPHIYNDKFDVIKIDDTI